VIWNDFKSNHKISNQIQIKSHVFQIKLLSFKSNHYVWFNHDLNQIMIWICPSLFIALLWVTLLSSFRHRWLQPCSEHSLPSRTSCTLSSILAMQAPFHDIFTATIYRGRSWPWRYWYCHISIDESIEVSWVSHNVATAVILGEVLCRNVLKFSSLHIIIYALNI